MQNKLFTLFIFLLPVFSCSKKEASIEKIIIDEMKQQEKCWNNGDIDCFMQSYWQNDSLRFIGKKGINYGWQTTLDNYKNNYPTPEDMGKLLFTLEEIKVFTASEAYVLGKWQLNRKGKENIEGYFSLLWRKIEGKWVIVSDHTS